MKKTSRETTAGRSASKKADPVAHFEMPAMDRKRMAKFYTTTFGWKTQMLGKDMGNYVIDSTTNDVGKSGKPRQRGIIGGGFYEKDKSKTIHKDELEFVI